MQLVHVLTKCTQLHWQHDVEVRPRCTKGGKLHKY